MYHYDENLSILRQYPELHQKKCYRNIEELMAERGADVDHSTVQKWVVYYAPLLEASFRKWKKLVGSSWKMDETYSKVNGKWVYLYRAVDKEGNTRPPKQPLQELSCIEC